MFLPSKWAPEGLSVRDQQKTITVGHNIKKPANYVIRQIETRVNDAIACKNNKSIDEDIEMIAIDDYEEVDAISSFIDYSRSKIDNDNEEMEIEYDSSPEFVVTSGNISYLVIDTNFIISHLNILNDLKNLAENYELRIIIPITVMRELDGLKSSSKMISDSDSTIAGKTVGHLARWANDWIYTTLADNSMVVKGQKLNQRLDKSVYQDDAILDCCLYLKHYNENSLVVLLSNDKNLCMKALTHDIKTVSFKKGMTGKFIAEVIHSENIQTYGKSNQVKVQSSRTSTPTEPINTKVVEPSKQWIEATQNTAGIQTIEESIPLAFKEIQAITISAVHAAMEKEYGSDLEIIRGYDHDSVTTLKDCSEVIIRFWLPVFQDYFKKSPIKFVPFQESNPGRGSNKLPIYVTEPENLQEFQLFVVFWGTTLQILYSGVMSETEINALEVLIERWFKLAKVRR